MIKTYTIKNKPKKLKKHKKKHLINKYTKKNVQIIHSGGNYSTKDKFEVTTLDNVDTSKFNVSKYINANIDWGIMPGPPPTDCCIM